MMRKVTLLTLVIVVGLAMGAHAQINGLSEDLQVVFDELGKDIVPNLQTASILNHELGSAELGDFPRMYLSFSAGATVAPGVLEFTRDEEKFGNYYLLDKLLEEAGANDADVRDITDNYAPYPSLRVGYGVGLFDGYELSLQLGIDRSPGGSGHLRRGGSDGDDHNRWRAPPEGPGSARPGCPGDLSRYRLRLQRHRLRLRPRQRRGGLQDDHPVIRV